MRLASGRSTSELAQLAGVAATTWLRIESRQRVPTIDTIERFARALGVASGWLAFGPQGEEPFRSRRPRVPVPPDEPHPRPGSRQSIARHKGLAGRLRWRRAALGLSLRALAERAGISAQAIVHVEAARVVPKVDTLESLARALGVSPGWLAFGQGEKPSAQG